MTFYSRCLPGKHLQPWIASWMRLARAPSTFAYQLLPIRSDTMNCTHLL